QRTRIRRPCPAIPWRRGSWPRSAGRRSRTSPSSRSRPTAAPTAARTGSPCACRGPRTAPDASSPSGTAARPVRSRVTPPIPAPRCTPVRGVLVGRLGVEGAVDLVRGDGGLPVRRGVLLPVPEVQVVPVDRDQRLTGRDGLGGDVDGDVVPVVLQLREEVDL